MIETDQEYLDFSKVPESQGVPPGLYRVVGVGLLIIFAIGAASAHRLPIAPELDVV